MWLGEQITSKGIGNGISIIIFIGIISGLPSGITTIWKMIFTSTGFSTTGLITALGIIIGALLLVAGVVFVQDAERRVQSATGSEKVKIDKKIKKLRDQTAEIHKYEEKVHHIADQMIGIDLDDGVKDNYAKLQDVLSKIK